MSGQAIVQLNITLWLAHHYLVDSTTLRADAAVVEIVDSSTSVEIQTAKKHQGPLA